MPVPAEILYLAAASAAGAFCGGLLVWILCRRRLVRTVIEKEHAAGEWTAANDALRALNEQYVDVSSRLAAANADLGHMRGVRDQLAEKETEIREMRRQISESASQQARLEEKIEYQRASMKTRAEMLEEIRSHAEHVFAALSSRALQENNRYFLDMARNTLARYFDAARSEMENKSRRVGDVVAPVAEALEKFDHEVRAMEQARQNAYGGLSQQVASLAESQQELQKETGRLVSALRLPHVRGRWGEMTLKRVVEIAGMQDHCDFYEQPARTADGETMRPDMIVRLPENRTIVIDAKVPVTAYLDSLEVESAEKTEEYLGRHAAHVQRHIGRLSRKSYFTGFSPTPEFVVMFMPGENFFSAALQQNPALIEEGSAKGVIPATPTTLISLLKTVSYGWRQDAAVKNAREVSELAGTLYSRISSLLEHVNRLGRDLDRCVTSYNKTAGSLEKRVLVSARRFREMGAAGNSEDNLEAPAAVERRCRRTDTGKEDFETNA